tara:strand:+ start:353 stop:574 length:222 start_codon:yes stop_codon:yes gene_type:complete
MHQIHFSSDQTDLLLFGFDQARSCYYNKLKAFVVSNAIKMNFIQRLTGQIPDRAIKNIQTLTIKKRNLKKISC